MLDYGVDPNLANDDGLTALHQVRLKFIYGSCLWYFTFTQEERIKM